MRHRRGGYDAQVEDVNAGRGDSRRDGRRNELPGCAGIAREEGDWSGVAFTFGEHLRCCYREREGEFRRDDAVRFAANSIGTKESGHVPFQDRKSTRLNSSHVAISYAVFCLKKKSIYIKSRPYTDIQL